MILKIYKIKNQQKNRKYKINKNQKLMILFNNQESSIDNYDTKIKEDIQLDDSYQI